MNPQTVEGVSASAWLERVTSNQTTVHMFMGMSFVIVLVALGVIGRTIRAVSRERTKREIAAYIAEGAMTPEQGERLVKSKTSGCE